MSFCTTGGWALLSRLEFGGRFWSSVDLFDLTFVEFGRPFLVRAVVGYEDVRFPSRHSFGLGHDFVPLVAFFMPHFA